MREGLFRVLTTPLSDSRLGGLNSTTTNTHTHMDRQASLWRNNSDEKASLRRPHVDRVIRCFACLVSLALFLVCSLSALVFVSCWMAEHPLPLSTCRYLTLPYLTLLGTLLFTLLTMSRTSWKLNTPVCPSHPSSASSRPLTSHPTVHVGVPSLLGFSALG